MINLEFELAKRGYDVDTTYRLGKGGFGKVYAGRRISDNLPVAAKCIDSTMVWHWSEYRVPMEVSNLLKVRVISGAIYMYDWFKIDRGGPYVIVTERSENDVTLADYLDCYRLREREAILLFIKIVRIVYDCWLLFGLLHCDVKEVNVLVDIDTGDIKLIDFDFVLRDSDKPRTSFCGTLEYAPPEWFLKHEYLPEASAVWTLGLLFFRLLFHEYPFRSFQQIRDFSDLNYNPIFIRYEHTFSLNTIRLLTRLLRVKGKSRMRLVALYNELRLLTK
ncbi:serine/threonine-protein kinase pim-1-like [Ixodes scapularis]